MLRFGLDLEEFGGQIASLGSVPAKNPALNGQAVVEKGAPRLLDGPDFRLPNRNQSKGTALNQIASGPSTLTRFMQYLIGFKFIDKLPAIDRKDSESLLQITSSMTFASMVNLNLIPRRIPDRRDDEKNIQVIVAVKTFVVL